MTTTPYLGAGTWIGVGEETVAWGAVKVRTAWSPVISVDLQEKQSQTVRPHLAVASSSFMPMSKVNLKTEVAGTVELLQRYTGMGFWLKALMGAVAESGAGPYVHKFTLGAPTSLASLSLEVVRGSSGNSEIFVGCQIARATLSFNAHDFAKIRAEIIGKKANAARGAAGVPSAGDDTDVLGHQMGVFSWNSGNHTLRSLEITVDNGLQARDVLGTLYTAQPMPANLRKVTAKAVLDADDALYAAYLAGSESDFSVSFTGDSPNVMLIKGQNAFIKSCSDPISQQGIVTQTLELECMADASPGTDTGLEISITNGDATYDIN